MKMTLPQVKQKAKALGIETGRKKLADLILAIQKAEGNTMCFGTGTPACPYTACCWRDDCIRS